MTQFGQFLHSRFLQALGVTFGPYSFFSQGAGPNTNIPWYSLGLCTPVWSLAYKLLWRTGHAKHNNSNVSDPRHWHTPCDLCWGVMTSVRGFQSFLSKLPSRYWSWEYPVDRNISPFLLSSQREASAACSHSAEEYSPDCWISRFRSRWNKTSVNSFPGYTFFSLLIQFQKWVPQGSEDRPLHGWRMLPSDHIWACRYQGPGTRAFCWTTSIVSAFPRNVCSLEWTGLPWAQFWGSELKLKVLVGLVSPKTPFLARVISPLILGPGNFFTSLFCLPFAWSENLTTTCIQRINIWLSYICKFLLGLKHSKVIAINGKARKGTPTTYQMKGKGF